MKIALVCPYDFGYPGGVAAHIGHLAEQITKVGHTVKIIAPALARPPDFPQQQNLIALGRPVPVPTGGSTARISLSIWLAPRIRALLRKERFDVVHIHEPLAPILPLTVLALSEAVNVGTFHAFHGSRRLYGLFRRPLRAWVSKLDGRIAVSRPALEFVSKYFPGDYRIIPPGIDVEHFSRYAYPLPELQDGKINILFVGRVRDKRKGLKYLLGAYSELKWKYPNIRLVVVGPGQPDGECVRMVDERGIGDVIFVGAVSHSDLPRYHRSAHIFCSPATGKESFGLVLLEAMAAGVPIVATAIEGYSQVVRSEREGILVPPRDEQGIARALEILIRDKEARRTLGQNGSQRAQEFHWPQVGARVLEYYQILLRQKTTDRLLQSSE